jgi:hypothetical protein
MVSQKTFSRMLSHQEALTHIWTAIFAAVVEKSRKKRHRIYLLENRTPTRASRSAEIDAPKD